jgi:hypothetical protein
MPWCKYVNKVEKALFDDSKPKLCFSKPCDIDVKPKALGKGFGWQASKPNQVVDVKMHENHIGAQVMTSICAHVQACSLSKEDFLAKARPLPNSIVMDLVRRAETRTFSTGSFGWHACTRQAISVKVGREDVSVVVNFNAILKGTRPDGTLGDGRPEQSVDESAQDDISALNETLASVDAEIQNVNSDLINSATHLKSHKHVETDRLALVDAETHPKRARLGKDLTKGDSVAQRAYAMVKPAVLHSGQQPVGASRKRQRSEDAA